MAAIDVGTNTTNLLVARIEGAGPVPLATGSAMTSLGEGLGATGLIGAEALSLAEQTVATMASEARALGAERIIVACTAIARDARNAPDLLQRLETAAGVRPRVLSGEDEARLTFLGLVAAGAPDPLLAADLGGGSLELMGGRAGDLRWAVSLPLGVRRMTERYGPSDPPALELLGPMTSHARGLISAVAREHPATSAVVAGGSPAALAVLADTTTLDRDALVHVVERLAASPSEDVAAETGLQPLRVRMCFAAAAVLEAVRRSFDLEAIEVSHAGLREGLVVEATA